MRLAAFLIVLLTALVQTSAAFAHASLVRAEPADGALVAEPPAALRLTFNEPVTPLVMRLIAPDGTSTTVAATAENTTVTVKPPALRRGTHVLSWRVISADGHPVGGSLLFSVGEATAAPVPGALPAGDPVVRGALWAAKVVIYLALLIGIGGAFARKWLLANGTPWLDRTLMAVIVAGLLATPLSVGLQGLDALDLKLPALAQRLVWETGLETSYGMTAIAAMIALFAALFAFEAPALEPRTALLAVRLDRRRRRAGAERARQQRRAAVADAAVGVRARRLRDVLGRRAAAADRNREGRGGGGAGAVLARHSLSARGVGDQRRHPGGGAARPRRCAVDDELRPRAVMQARGGDRAARARRRQPLRLHAALPRTRTQPRPAR